MSSTMASMHTAFNIDMSTDSSVPSVNEKGNMCETKCN